MAGEENNSGEIEVPEGQVIMSQEEAEAGRVALRNQVATDAGIDLKNPAAELVLEKFQPGMTAEDMKPLVEKYNVGMPPAPDEDADGYVPPTPKVEEYTGPEGAGSQSQARGDLANGKSVAGKEIQFGSAAEEVTALHDGLVEGGASFEDARVAAMDTLFKRSGEQAAYNRIRGRQADEERINALMARRDANSGGGN